MVDADGSVFAHTEVEGFEQVVFGHDADTGLKAIIALHSTVLGPGLGGTRFRPYASEAEAVADVCRLARGMTYKHAVSGLDCGGGKAVILGDPRRVRTDALMRAYGRLVHSLGGRYLTAEDVGTTQADMDLLFSVTPHVTGTSEALGGSGDPSPATAWGVWCALGAIARRLWGTTDLSGRHVVVSGVGKVGSALVDHLVAGGARVTVTDVDPGAIEAVMRSHPGVAVVGADRAHAVECEVFSPCALGGVLNESTIPDLLCEAVCGSANNQLGEPADGLRLAEQGVLYAPDFVANAGGVINIAQERDPSGTPYDRERAWDRVAGIAGTLTAVLDRAEADGVTPVEAAVALADQRLAAAVAPGPSPTPGAEAVTTGARR